MTTIRLIAALAIVTAISGPAPAEEQFIELKDAPGKIVAEQHCGGCHSLDYIGMNSPFLKAEVWDAEIAKMLKTFGAPISDADAKAIREYLVQNYGG
jgi:mono/diheme cytochrome c family protein